MSKYHVNKQGNPGICVAQPGNCKFGGDDDHFSTPQEAMSAYEKMPIFGDSAKKSVSNNSLRDEVQKLNDQKDIMGEALSEYQALPKNVDSAVRKNAWKKYTDLRDERANMVSDLEHRGLGHLIPDDGRVLRVGSVEQKLLFKNEIMGQISDGYWENTAPYDHWEAWGDAEVIVDPKNIGRNFMVRKDNYGITRKDLLEIVGDRMVDDVKNDPDGDPNYNEAKMMKDLRALKAVFKTSRKTRTQDDVDAEVDSAVEEKRAIEPKQAPAPAPVAPTPSPVAVTGSKQNVKNVNNSDKNSMVKAAMASPGVNLPETTYYSLHCGMANPTNGDGDEYDHIADGGVVIVGKADGSRARVIAGAGETLSDPENQLGQKIYQIKQRHNGPDAATSDLRVLGYRDRSGNSFGWVPDKKIQYFVFK